MKKLDLKLKVICLNIFKLKLEESVYKLIFGEYINDLHCK